MPRPFRPGTTQNIAYTATAGTVANPFGAACQYVRVVCTSAAYIRISNSPTATTSDVYMPANAPEYFVAAPSMKVSAVQVAAGGTVYVTEVGG